MSFKRFFLDSRNPQDRQMVESPNGAFMYVEDHERLMAEVKRDLATTREVLAATQDALDAKNQVDRTADSADDALREAVIAAYKQGALDVHRNYQPDRDPDFTEAAHDYAASTVNEAAHRPNCASYRPDPSGICPNECDCGAADQQSVGEVTK